jgi:hypothetical protein
MITSNYLRQQKLTERKMKKSILIILLSTFLCGPISAEKDSIFTEEKTDYTERYSAITDEDFEETDPARSFSDEDVDCVKDYCEEIMGNLEEGFCYSDEYTDVKENPCNGIEEKGGENLLADATSEKLLSLLSSCKEYTLDDGVEAADLKNYLLLCINNMLSEGGYKLIKSLPLINNNH